MGTAFALYLSAHIFLGVIGVIASFMAVFLLLKSELSLSLLRKVSLTAFLGYFLSWFSGGWYYWKWYGANVKPSIVGGDYAWAHFIIMEVKEHIFLFLPFASLALYVIIRMCGDRLTQDAELKKQTFLLALAVFIIAAIVTVSGVIISGAAR